MTIPQTCLLLTMICCGLETFAQSTDLDKIARTAPRPTVSLELRRSHAYVSVRINNQGPFHFAVDTGFAGEALISKAVAERLGLSPSGVRVVGDPSGIGDHQVRSYRVGSIQLGDETFQNTDAGEDLPIPGPDGPRDGVLGFAFFKHRLLSLDYPSQQLVFGRGQLTPRTSDQVVPYTLSKGVPTVILHYGQITFAAHIDSGGMGLSLPETLAAKLSFQTEPRVMGRMMSASNAVEIKGGQLSGDINMAGYVFRSPFVEVNPLFPEATIGSIPLSRFRVSFDEDRQLVRFESPEAVIDLAPPRRPTMQGTPQ